MKFPNGYGTVYKLSGNRRKPYIARVAIGSKIVVSKKTGKERLQQLYQIIGYFVDKPSAIDALAKHRFSPVVPKANITLSDLYDEWSLVKYEYISKQTEDCYKAAWKHMSKFGKAKFKELRTSHIQSVINGCYKAGMSRSSLEKIKIVAVMLYSYAMQNDIVNKNYAEFLVLPKSVKEEKKIFTDLAIKKMEDSKELWVDTILVLIYTGMRINEMLSLSPFSVNLKEEIITGGLKTEAGKNRAIPIHHKILGIIKKWYDKGGEYLICNEDGKHINDKYYREKLYYPALEKLEIQKLNPHCCRHTCASLLSKAGADHKYIQMIIGHSKYSFTADNYTHPDFSELRKAISLI